MNLASLLPTRIQRAIEPPPSTRVCILLNRRFKMLMVNPNVSSSGERRRGRATYRGPKAQLILSVLRRVCFLGSVAVWWHLSTVAMNNASDINLSSVTSSTEEIRDLHDRDEIIKHHKYSLDCMEDVDLSSRQLDKLDTYTVTSTFPPFNMSVHNPTTDCPVSSDIVKYGCYECHTLKAAMAALRDAPPETSLLDIGSNIGLYGLSAAAMGRRAYMIEPAKTNQRHICRSIDANEQFPGLLSVFKVAATNLAKPGVIGLLGTGNLNKGGVNTQDKGTVYSNEERAGTEGVDYAQAIRIDWLQGVLPPAGSSLFLKIDVEGEECNALGGAMEYLNSVKIKYAAIEWSQERLIDCSQREAIFDLFSRNGLKPYQAKLEGLDTPSGWEELDPAQWREWIWRAPGRKRPEKALFDVAWAKSQPLLFGDVKKTTSC